MNNLIPVNKILLTSKCILYLHIFQEASQNQVSTKSDVASQTQEEACGILPSENLVCPNCETKFVPPKGHVCGLLQYANLIIKARRDEDNDSGTGSVECIPMVVMKS